MQDVCKLIILLSDLDSLRNLYLVSKVFNQILNDPNTIIQLSNIFNVISNDFNSFINQSGMLCIPKKSRHTKDKGSYVTHFNGQRLKVIINDGVEISPIYYTANTIKYQPLTTFIGRDPFNDRKDQDLSISYNPNVNDEKDYFTKGCDKTPCLCGKCKHFTHDIFCKEGEDECTCGLCIQYLTNINDYYHYCYDIDRAQFDGSSLLLY